MADKNMGRMATFPGGNWSKTRAYVAPLKAIGGEVALAVAANTPISDTPAANSFGFLVSIDIMVTGVPAGAGAGDISILNGTGGTVIDKLSFLIKPVVNSVYRREFVIPPRTALAAAPFVATVTGTDYTFAVSLNGYTSEVLGTVP